jgi:hypothetical protein
MIFSPLNARPHIDLQLRNKYLITLVIVTHIVVFRFNYKFCFFLINFKLIFILLSNNT